jgi:hypothetical protein
VRLAKQQLSRIVVVTSKKISQFSVDYRCGTCTINDSDGLGGTHLPGGNGILQPGPTWPRRKTAAELVAISRCAADASALRWSWEVQGHVFLTGARPLVESNPSMRLHELLDWNAIAGQLKAPYQ